MPTVAATTAQREASIRQACRELIPPLLLATPGGWRLVDEESGAAQEAVARHAEAVVEWVEGCALSSLQSLLDLVTAEANEHEEVSLQTKALVAATAARFVSPRKRARAGQFTLSAWTDAERHLWTSEPTLALAVRILRSSMLQSGDESVALQREIVDTLLQSYIRPLFSSTPSGSINNASGRAAHRPKATGALMEDEIVWKGGDVERAHGKTLLGEPIIASVTASSSSSKTDTCLDMRHAGLGSDCVFFVCCQSIAAWSEASVTKPGSDEGDDSWTTYWPQVLPPLLQLLDDTSPRFRLVGARILCSALFNIDSSTTVGQRQGRRVGLLLMRTGVAGLFRQVLETNATFITNRVSGALLQCSTQAWEKLLQVTTDDETSTTSHVDRDGGRARYEGLSKLLDDGVLRVWAYAPSSVTASDMEQSSTRATEEENENGQADVFESDDVIDASIAVLARLARPEGLGVGIVRYLDVTLEFLTQQLLGVEVKLERAAQRHVVRLSPLKGDVPPRVNLARETVAAQAIVSLLDVAHACPAVAPWCARCVTSAARCWLLVHETHGTSTEELDGQLRTIVRLMRRAQPEETEEVVRKLFLLDEAAFSDFLAEEV